MTENELKSKRRIVVEDFDDNKGWQVRIVRGDVLSLRDERLIMRGLKIALSLFRRTKLMEARTARLDEVKESTNG